MKEGWFVENAKGGSLEYVVLTTWIDTIHNLRYCQMVCEDLVKEGVRARVKHEVRKGVPRVSVMVAVGDVGRAKEVMG